MISFKESFEQKRYPDLLQNDEIHNPPSNALVYDSKFHEDLSSNLHAESKPLHDPEMDPFYLRSFTRDWNTRDQRDYIENAHASSRDLNIDLINHGEPKRLIDKRMHEAIMRNVSPAKRDFHVYSGTRADLGELAKNSASRILVSPAHISASSCPNVAREHIERIHDNSQVIHHIAHIHVQKGNPYLHLSEYSEYPDEYETLIPSGTKLKYSHTSMHEEKALVPRRDPIVFHVHHFTISN